MPAQKKSGQRRAQGGGRNPNSEPKLQLFKDFGGVNFEHAYRGGLAVDVNTERTDGSDQTDLQMNFMFLQNNVAVRSNRTLETRNDIVELFVPPPNADFTGPTCLIGKTLYVALSDTSLAYIDLDENEGSLVELRVPTVNRTGSVHEWTSLDYYDNKLIALTKQNEMWTMDVHGVFELENAKRVPDPQTDFTGHLTGMGDLVVSMTATEECPYRVMIAHTWVNKFGPTTVSPNTVFYVNHPVSEWHAGRYLRIDGTLPHEPDYDASEPDYCVSAVELYYATDNAMDMLFLGRVDVSVYDTTWSYDWFGYIDATSMWPIANLIAPTENYTKGVHASRITDIDGRLYFWGDSQHAARVYMGGNPGNLLSVSPGTGGGFVDVEPGSGQRVRYVCKYKTQSGNSIVTMLCDSQNSKREKRFNLVENSIAVSNEQSMKSWQAEQVAGSVGCKSYHGALVCEDGLYSVSRYGVALTTMTMEYNAQIRTTYVSDAIKPVFTDSADIGTRLSKAMLLELNGILYLALGSQSDLTKELDNVLFCYDINAKTWWTYTINTDTPILGLFHIDWQGGREGIGIITKRHIYLLPTTDTDIHRYPPKHNFMMQTAKLSTQMPQQGWQYLSQLEFHFDYFVGTMFIMVRMTDMFGREITAYKRVTEDEICYDYVVRMRIDQRIMSYTIRWSGNRVTTGDDQHESARFRMSHFIARVYTMSNKVGQVWGFDDRISHRSSGRIHPTFKCYNDIQKALFV